MSNPFFPDPLDKFKPEKPDFEPETDPDYDDNACPLCSVSLESHTMKQLVECALLEIRYPKGGVT